MTPPEPDAKARRQAKLDEAEKRDQARRAKAAGGASKVVDAPEAVPEKVADDTATGSYDQSQGDAAKPIPEKAADDVEAEAVEPEQTILHEEL